MMKKVFLTVVAVFALGSLNYTAKSAGAVIDSSKLLSIPKVADFAFIEEIDYGGDLDIFTDNKTGLKVYVLSIKNSTDKLVTFLNKGGILIPLAFYNNTSNRVDYKDVNNRQVVTSIILKNDGKVKSVSYQEANDSKTGYALSFGCPGGSTLRCVEKAISSCANDPECAFWCGVTVEYCVPAIVVSCAVSCNMQ